MTTVTLSGAPASSVAAIRPSTAVRMLVVRHQLLDPAVGHRPVRPSEHSRNRSPARTRRDTRRAPGRFAADRPGDGAGRLAFGQLAGLGQAVIARQLLEPPVAQPVDPAVAAHSTAQRVPRTSSATTVLPLCTGVVRRARSARTRWSFTSRIRSPTRSTRSARSSRPGMKSASASQTIRLATSPSLWPPRPSATAHSPTSGRSRNESWLICRTLARRRSRRPTGTAAASDRRSAPPAPRRPGRRAPAPIASDARSTRRRAARRSVSGCGSPLAIRQLGSTIADPSVHHSTERLVERRQALRDAAARTPAPSCAGDPSGICQLAGRCRRESAPPPSATTTRGRRRADVERRARGSPRARRSPRSRSRSAASVSTASCSARVEERLERRRGGDHAGVRRQLGDERQVKVAADAIDARHHQADDRRGAERARGAGEAPRRAGQVDVEPAVAERSRGSRRCTPAARRPRRRRTRPTRAGAGNRRGSAACRRSRLPSRTRGHVCAPASRSSAAELLQRRACRTDSGGSRRRSARLRVVTRRARHVSVVARVGLALSARRRRSAATTPTARSSSMLVGARRRVLERRRRRPASGPATSSPAAAARRAVLERLPVDLEDEPRAPVSSSDRGHA